MKFALALLAVSTLTLPLAMAHHCTTWSTSVPEVDFGGFYIDNDPCQPACLFSLWVYQETNDIPGLQRGDEVKDDTCHGMIESDILPD